MNLELECCDELDYVCICDGSDFAAVCITGGYGNDWLRRTQVTIYHWAATFRAAKMCATWGRAMLKLREDVGHFLGTEKAAEHSPGLMDCLGGSLIVIYCFWSFYRWGLPKWNWFCDRLMFWMEVHTKLWWALLFVHKLFSISSRVLHAISENWFCFFCVLLRRRDIFKGVFASSTSGTSAFVTRRE